MKVALLLLSAMVVSAPLTPVPAQGPSTVVVASSAGGLTHVLIITGLSAEPRFATAFGDAARAVFDAARTSWHVADSNLVYLAENPAADPKRITGKSTRAEIASAFGTLARRVQPGDVVLVLLVGHGSGELGQSAVNLPGPDATATDYAGWISALGAVSVVFVNASSGSGDFAPMLAGTGRVVVTATRTAIERNESIFAAYFAAGLTGTEADADKDGRVSVLEAFDFARDRVHAEYERTNRLQTEHPLLADSSGIAARISFGAEIAIGDARVTALVGERRVLERSVDSLRRLKTAMDSTSYEQALEHLLLQIADHTRAINALRRGTPP